MVRVGQEQKLIIQEDQRAPPTPFPSPIYGHMINFLNFLYKGKKMSIQKARQGLASEWAAGDTPKHFREQATVRVEAGFFFSGAENLQMSVSLVRRGISQLRRINRK